MLIINFKNNVNKPTKRGASSSSNTPPKLLMGREFRWKLPSSPKSNALLNAKARVQKSKEYYDKRFRPKPSSNTCGETVLLKQVKNNKLSTTFNVSPYKVVSVKGSVIRA